MAQEMLSSKRRTSYSLATKLRAVDEAERSGLKEAARAMRVHEGVLRQWVGKGHALRLAGEKTANGTKKRLPRSPQVFFPRSPQGFFSRSPQGFFPVQPSSMSATRLIRRK